MTANQFPLIVGPLLLAGADVARALFPAHGIVKASPLRSCRRAAPNSETHP